MIIDEIVISFFLLVLSRISPGIFELELRTCRYCKGYRMKDPGIEYR
jgi:hypothetical protein